MVGGVVAMPMLLWVSDGVGVHGAVWMQDGLRLLFAQSLWRL